MLNLANVSQKELKKAIKLRFAVVASSLSERLKREDLYTVKQLVYAIRVCGISTKALLECAQVIIETSNDPNAESFKKEFEETYKQYENNYY